MGKQEHKQVLNIPLDQIPQVKELQDRIRKLEPLAKFGEVALESLKDCISDGTPELDAEGLANEAVRCGLMEYVPYEPKKHKLYNEEYFEPGEMIYYWGV